MDRCNLSVLLLPSQADWPNSSHTMVSRSWRRCLTTAPHKRMLSEAKGCLRNRLKGSDCSIGWAMAVPNSGLSLEFGHNPVGAFLPPKQKPIEAQFRRELILDMASNSIICIPSPTCRSAASWNFWSKAAIMTAIWNAWRTHLIRRGRRCHVPLYVIGRLGRQLYDCDFNQMLDLPVGHGSSVTYPRFRCSPSLISVTSSHATTVMAARLGGFFVWRRRHDLALLGYILIAKGHDTLLWCRAFARSYLPRYTAWSGTPKILGARETTRLRKLSSRHSRNSRNCIPTGGFRNILSRCPARLPGLAKRLYRRSG